ncbi:MAG TPA: hypothetical protein VE377_14090 [Candidatus Dormibacteraeota bacterium]|nr:hypothetical protein [Candidatus Dormibacteraeota bacterium]
MTPAGLLTQNEEDRIIDDFLTAHPELWPFFANSFMDTKEIDAAWQKYLNNYWEQYFAVSLAAEVMADSENRLNPLAANNGTPTTPVIQQANGKFKPNVPPEWGFCGKYRDGSGGGSALYQICMNTPNSPWGNCVRGTLLNQYTPNPNPPELFVYLFVDHPVDFASCLGK